MVLQAPSRPSCPCLAVATEGALGRLLVLGSLGLSIPSPPGQEQEGAELSRQGTALWGWPLEAPGKETGPGPRSCYSQAQKTETLSTVHSSFFPLVDLEKLGQLDSPQQLGRFVNPKDLDNQSTLCFLMSLAIYQFYFFKGPALRFTDGFSFGIIFSPLCHLFLL